MQANLQYCLWGYLQFLTSFLFYYPSLQPGSCPAMLPPWRWRHRPNNPYLKTQQKEKSVTEGQLPQLHTGISHLNTTLRWCREAPGGLWERGRAGGWRTPVPAAVSHCAPGVTGSSALYMYINKGLIHIYIYIFNIYIYIYVYVCVYVGIRATETSSGGWPLELPALP